MKKKLTLLLMLFLLVKICFGQTDTVLFKVDHYKTKKFDVAIFHAYYYDLISGQRFTPTKSEIDKAENVLRSKLKGLNSQLINQSSSPIIHRKLNKYKRQYFGYIDKNGHRILLINCFWAKDKDFKEIWLKARVIVLDGGSYYWNVKYNLDTGELFELDINGYA
jgi:hypothetical protein